MTRPIDARRHLRRGRVAALAGFALLLTGCTGEDATPGPSSDADADATASPSPTPSGPSAAEGPYRVGDCWQEDDYATATDWRSWEGTDAVDCAEPHNTVTYGAGDLPEDFPYPAEGEEMDDEAWDTAWAVCGDVEEALDLRMPLPPLHRLKTFMYLPTADQWADGARFVRCDVGLREWNRPASDRTLAPLEHTLTTLGARIDGYPEGFEMCYLEVEGSDESLLVSCAGDYSWRWVEDFEPEDHVGGPYPGEAVFEALVQDRCERQTLGGAPAYNCWASYPTAEEWAEGETTIRMWMSRIG